MVKINFERYLLKKIIYFRETTKVNGRLSKKFIGAITIELLRRELIKEGFNVSNRDVYIEGVNHELDLLILKAKERAKENLLYNPSQVVAIFEIKFSGIYSVSDIDNIKKAFSSIKKINREIKCVYLTVSEMINFTYYHKERKLGDFNCFLFKRDTDLERAIKENRLKATGDWDKLIKFLKSKN